MTSPTDMKVYYYIFDTSFGRMFLASTDNGICMANFIDDDAEAQFSWLKKYFYVDNIIEERSRNLKAFNQLEEYFNRGRRVFDLKLHLIGTDFQEAVWKMLTEIPFGEILTYGDVSCSLGDAKKSRAVGGAVGKNPIVIIVPCHRVIGSSGKLTGFSSIGGLELKKRLLDLENDQVSF